MLFRLHLINSEIEYIPDAKYIDTETTGYTLPPGIYEITDKNSLLKN